MTGGDSLRARQTLETVSQAEVLPAVHEKAPIHHDERWLGIWLTAKFARSHSPHTVRSYRSTVGRWLRFLRARYGDQASLLGLARAEDAATYALLLMAPVRVGPGSAPSAPSDAEPSARLPVVLSVGNAGALDVLQGALPDWTALRPPARYRQAITILALLYRDLAEIGYGDDTPVPRNPFALLARSLPGSSYGKRGAGARRALTEREWEWVREAMRQLPDDGLGPRDRWMLVLLEQLWARRAEVASLRWDCFVLSADGWTVSFVAKGGRERTLPCSGRLIDELRRYRRLVGYASELPVRADAGESVLCGRAGIGKTRISPNTVYAVVRRVFQLASDLASNEDPQAAERLRASAPHRIRHTRITQALDHNVDPRIVQEIGGHRSLATTTGIYDTRTDRAVRAALDRL